MIFFVFMLTLPYQSFAQNEITAFGKVLDIYNEPIIGASVSAIGAERVGTITNIDGEFSLKVKSDAIVTISFIGYKSTQVSANKLKGIDIVLEEDAQALDEVIVVAYGTQKKETMSGSISQIKASEMLKSPVANMGQALTGRAVGVTTYQSSGQPGADDVTIRIRGTGTLNSASPLVLVDGVEREFSQIDPNEIENMSILKDAASTAVFGIRGANGVIIITTKSGREGPPNVSFSANFAIQQATRMPQSLSAADVARMYNEAKYNDDPTLSPTFTSNDIELYENGLDPLAHININWSDYMMKNASFQQKYNLSVSGGTKNTKYYTSISFFDQGGIMKDFSQKIDNVVYKSNYDYKRINIRSNVNVDVTSTTKLGVQIGAVIGNRVAPPDVFSSIINTAPLVGPFIYNRKLVALPDIPFSPSQIGRANV